ncbi:MAG: helix-turn-helix transcriptional regulator [Armatimonadetes bacterium]|nr:helix-turn-helix transcriptional regulator [Armatimonadota bacterium]
MDRVEEVFKALADRTRLRLLKLLAGRELCVCEMVDALGMPQYKVSRHLGILRRAGLVADRREGTWIFYSVAPDISSFEEAVLEAVHSKLPMSEASGDADRLCGCLRPEIRKGIMYLPLIQNSSST